LQAWLDDTAGEAGDRLVVMHGISSRVLRGLLTGAPRRTECRAPVADPIPQGSVACVEDGRETVLA
ncbi:MAG: histidine phosphatase family protein, partial [Pseudomonadota bacterium]|nr:histidine phosphatase family protein [Pseudomonadota bacterium]